MYTWNSNITKQFTSAIIWVQPGTPCMHQGSNLHNERHFHWKNTYYSSYPGASEAEWTLLRWCPPLHLFRWCLFYRLCCFIVANCSPRPSSKDREGKLLIFMYVFVWTLTQISFWTKKKGYSTYQSPCCLGGFTNCISSLYYLAGSSYWSCQQPESGTTNGGLVSGIFFSFVFWSFCDYFVKLLSLYK